MEECCRIICRILRSRLRDFLSVLLIEGFSKSSKIHPHVRVIMVYLMHDAMSHVRQLRHFSLYPIYVHAKIVLNHLFGWYIAVLLEIYQSR